ncbi:ATP-grasp ribosomal peptide maturase [Peterkaempfera bronchialis]|uniref:ATP-grasp ribosomal peptide maturase n=1 Tax=Peterkaempfera bronchialis TaxID=2126346 RepID=UPI003C2BE866
MGRTVLVVTALEDVTADLVIECLIAREVPVVRVDPADLGPDLHFEAAIGDRAADWGGRLRTPSRELELGQVAAVYYRRPSPWCFERLPPQARDFAKAEARHGLGGLLANLPGANYVNHPAAVNHADYKPAQLQTAARLGFAVPPTLVTNDVAAAQRFAAEHGPVIYKPFRGLPAGPDGHTGAIWAQRVDPDAFDGSIEVTAHLFQAEVPKTGDVRVTVVGSRVFAQRIHTAEGSLDWRRGDWDALRHTPAAVPDPVRVLLHAYLRCFGLVFGCFDFALSGPEQLAESWTWIECNPNGQWAWLPDADGIAGAFAEVLMEGGAR